MPENENMAIIKILTFFNNYILYHQFKLLLSREKLSLCRHIQTWPIVFDAFTPTTAERGKLSLSPST